jgi:iron(III) transport system substrate-binding protein
MKKSFGLLLIAMFLLSLVPISAQETLTVLCTPQEDWCVAMTQAFEEETGIETEYVRMSSGESLARIRATAEDPEFSVWWGGPADAFIAAAEEGLLEPYESPNAEAISEELRDAENFTWTGIYVGAIGFCSNVEMLEELGVEAPTSWEDLLDPAFESNISMAHPATSGTAFTSFWTNVTLAADMLEADEDDETMGYDEEGFPTEAAYDLAFEYFGELHPNMLQYNRSGSAAGGMAGRGEIAVAIIFSHDCVKLQVEGYEGIVINTFPEEGTGYEIGGMGILKNAPEMEAAKMWYDWALTAEAQAIGATVNSLQVPTNPDTPVPELAINMDDVNLVIYNFTAAGMNRTEMVERFDEDVAPIPTD